MAIVDEIAQYLNDQGLGVFDEDGATGDIFIATLPDKPDAAIGLYMRGGSQADSGLGYDLPAVQVLVRGSQDPRTGAEKAQAIYDKLHGFHSDRFIPSGAYVVSCLGVQSAPIHIGQDEKLRHEYSLNFGLDILRG